MRALLIKWDSRSGKRAGNINPKDPKLLCHGWQKIDEDHPENCWEIRLVEDNRDLSIYDGVVDVFVLNGVDEINQAMDDNLGNQYRYVKTDSDIFKMACEQNKVDFKILATQKTEANLKDFFNNGIAGIEKQKRFYKL